MLQVRDRVFIHAAALSLSLNSQDFSTQEMVNMMYAFARLGWQDEEGLMDPVTADMETRLSTFIPQDFSNSMWAFSRMRLVLPPTLLDAFADAAIPHLHLFKPQVRFLVLSVENTVVPVIFQPQCRSMFPF